MNNSLPILIVEDDAALREALCDTLEISGYRPLAADGGPAALKLLESEQVAMVVSDVQMHPMDGLALLKEIRSRHPQLPVLLMTAYGDVDKAVTAMRAGACDFILKPFEPQTLLEQIAHYRLSEPSEGEGVVASDPASRELFALAARVAQVDATVLLTGESGTGKEVVARYIHRRSRRAAAPFVAINCAAIPENLLEATLFGYEKGAFTGANAAQPGKFEQAQGGTLLLDEISEMPLALQSKLLRVLQEREVERVGGKKPIALDIRIVATSNRDMAEYVARGSFREDLYYRLNVFPLRIPALRERREDIVAIARHFLREHGPRMGRMSQRFTPAAEAALRAYSWPGNVRELENVVQRALILTPGEEIDVGHLQLPVAAIPVSIGLPPPPPPQAATLPPANNAANGAAEFAVSAPATPGASPVGVVPDANTGDSGKAASMRDLEREHILKTLADVGGSRKLAVERLGISERTLRYKLKQYREEGLLSE